MRDAATGGVAGGREGRVMRQATGGEGVSRGVRAADSCANDTSRSIECARTNACAARAALVRRARLLRRPRWRPAWWTRCSSRRSRSSSTDPPASWPTWTR
eukprot:167900-Chlamydomonas_euryale.AAC.1